MTSVHHLGIVLALCGSALAGCRAREPGAIERAVVTAVKHRLTVRGRGDVNPLRGTAREIARGRDAFHGYCVACHGPDGRNTGVAFAGAMSPPVPHLDSPEVQGYTDGQLRWVIENGLFPSGMPAARGLLSEEEVWRIVLFLRHLPQVPEASNGS